MYIETSIDETKLSLVDISEVEFLKNKVENGDILFTRSSLVKAGIAQSNIYGSLVFAGVTKYNKNGRNQSSAPLVQATRRSRVDGG